MKALNLDKLDAFMEIEYDGEIYNAYTKMILTIKP